MQNRDDDLRLIERAQRGDSTAFDSLARIHQDIAFRTAWIILRHEQDAQDVCQTAFEKAWIAMPRFRPGHPFRPWLLQIVANEARNHRKSRWRWLQTHADSDDHYPDSDTAELPDALVARSETSTELLRAIELLGKSDQQLLLLRYAVGLSESELAETLQIPRGTVKSRLHRAMARLREVIPHEQ